MTAALLSIITANWQAIAGVFAMIGAALGLYAKGLSDAKAKAKLKDITDANRIRKDGADARARAAADIARGGLHSDDGWKRD